MPEKPTKIPEQEKADSPYSPEELEWLKEQKAEFFRLKEEDTSESRRQALAIAQEVKKFKIKRDPEFAEKMRKKENSVDVEKAKEIMGKNFLGVEDAIKHFKLEPTPEQLEAFKTIPFSKETLEECKDTHILVADFGLSILDIRERVDKDLFYRKKGQQAWFDNEDFAKEEAKPAFRLIRKDFLPDSTEKTWGEQQEIIPENEEVPKAREMVNAIILNYLATGERLLETKYVRTNSLAADGGRVYVGRFDSGGLGVDDGRDDGRNDDLGLSSFRKN